MRFVVIHKDKIDNIPPLISAMYILCDLGQEVKLITCGVNDKMDSEFKRRGIEYTVLPYATAKSSLAKVTEYLKFRRGVKKLIEKERSSILWIEGAYTIRALGHIIKGYKYVLQISELHEKSKPQLKAIGKVIHEAQVVFMPEYNRSVIYQIWFGLKNRPTVLPNKPYFIPSKVEIEKLKSKYIDLIRLFAEKKVVLYQGWIGYDRDISAIIKAVKKMGDDFVVAVVGRDCGILKDYQSIDSRIIHIDYMPAPDYLVFTSMAYIGILSYIPIDLNNAYCAPNKIYEYGAFGLPMIGNDIPGLKIIEYEKAGCVVDINDEESILKAIQIIDKDYTSYSNASKALYEETDNQQIIKVSLERITNNNQEQ